MLTEQDAYSEVIGSMEEPSLDLRELVNLLSRHASHWRSIGIRLGVPHSVLNMIQSDNAHYPDMCQRCLESVLCWHLKQGNVLTREDIALLEEYVRNIHSYFHNIPTHITYFLSAVAFALLLAYIITKVNEKTHHEEVKYFNSTLVPLPFTPFVGREAECNDIMMLLEYESSPITAVSLVAPFGYGKSELAKEIGNRIALNETSVQFIDLIEVSDAVLFDDAITWHLALATGSNPSENIKLPVLAKRMTSNTLLILDNCDAMFSSAENDLHFQEFLEYTIQLFSPLLKLLTTSRRRAPFLNANFEVYFLSSLSTDSAIEFLVQLGVPTDDGEMLAGITQEVENVPYSLRAIGTKLKLQLLIDPEVMYYQLRHQNLIDILAPHLKHKAESSIYMTYRQITPSRDCRKWSYWFITNAPSHSMPMWSNNLFCLNELLEHSMIIPYQESNETYYIVPRIVREFYQHTLGKSPIYIALRPDVSLDSLLDSSYIHDNTMLA